MGIVNKEEVLYMATRVDITGLQEGKKEVLEILKTLAEESSSIDVFSGISQSAAVVFTKAAESIYLLSQEFDQVMQDFATRWPEAGGQLEGFREQILALTAEIPVTATECGRALSDIFAAGYKGTEAMSQLERAAREAAVGVCNVADAFVQVRNQGSDAAYAFYLPVADWEVVVGSVEAQMQLLQNRLLVILRPMGEQLMKQVAEVAIGLGQALADGKIVSGLKSLDTLATVAAIALREYKGALEESVGVITTEGAALGVVTDLREAYQTLLGEGNALREEEEVRLQAYLAGLGEVRQAEADNGAAKMEVLQQSLRMASDLSQIVAEEIVRIQAKKEACADELHARELALQVAQEEYQQTGLQVDARQEEYNLIKWGNDAIAEELAAGKLREAQEKQSTAALRLGNAEREVRNAQLRVEKVNQQGATASVVANTMATGGSVAADAAATTSTTLLARAKQYATVATRSLTAAMAANPIGMVLNVVSLAITAFSAFGKETDGVATAQERLNEALEKQKSKTNDLIGTLYNQNEADSTRVEALLELRKLYPEVWNKVDLANLSEQDRNKLLKEGNRLLTERKEKELEAAMAASMKKQKRLEDDIEIAIQTDSGLLAGSYANKLDEERKQYRALGDELEHIRKVKEMIAGLSLSKEDKLKMYESELVVLRERLEEVNTQLSFAGSNLKAGKSVNPADNFQVAQLMSEQENLQEQIGSKVIGITELRKQPKATDEDLRSRKLTAQQLTDMVVRMELERQKRQIAVMEDGRLKRKKQVELEYQEREKEIAKKERELTALYQKTGEQVPRKELDMLAQLREDNREELEHKTKKIDQDSEAEIEARINAQKNLFLSAEQQKLEAIEERYKKERAWAESQRGNAGFDGAKQEEYLRTLDKNEADEKKAVLLSGLKDAQQELDRAIAEWKVKTEAAQGDNELQLKLKVAMDKDISKLEVNKLIDSEEWVTLFGDLDTLTVTEIDKLMSTIEEKMTEAKLLPIDKNALLNNLNEAKQKVIEINPFRSLGNSLRDEFTQGSEESRKSKEVIQNEWKNLGKSTQGCFDFINDAVTGCEVLGDLLGESGKASLGMVQGIATAGIAMGSAIKEAEASSIVLTAISVALQAVNALFSIFSKDKKKDAQIKKMRGEVEQLERAYNKLGNAIDNTYSDEAFNMMDKQNDNLRQQQELIRQQIAAEQSKKKTDNGKIREWQNQLEDIDQQIEENQRKRIEILAGTDVKSAIDEFADALVEAYAKGEDGAVALAETTKKVMANAVKEALKRKFLGEQIESAVNELGNYMSDGILTETEQSKFRDMVNAAGERFTEALKAYNGLFEDETGGDGSGVSGQLQEAMTEGTASQLVGLWNMTANDIRSMRNLTAEQIMLCSMMNLNVGEVLRQQFLIEMNTRRTADNTAVAVEEVKSGFTRIDSRLKAIDLNTKGYTGRGK